MVVVLLLLLLLAAVLVATTRGGGGQNSKAKNDSLHVDFKELQIEEMIGQGAFGTVHRAKWRGTAVAVKILVCQHLTADILEEFEAEVQIMTILRYAFGPFKTVVCDSLLIRRFL